MFMSDNIERSLGRIEAKLTGLVDSHVEIKVALTRLDTRTSSLERWQSRIVGGAAVAGFVFGMAVQFIRH